MIYGDYFISQYKDPYKPISLECHKGLFHAAQLKTSSGSACLMIRCVSLCGIPFLRFEIPSGKLTNIAGWKMDPD